MNIRRKEKKKTNKQKNDKKYFYVISKFNRHFISTCNK